MFQVFASELIFCRVVLARKNVSSAVKLVKRGPGCACRNCENSPVCSCSEEVDTSLEDEETAEDSARKRREEVVETDDEDAESGLSGDEMPEDESR